MTEPKREYLGDEQPVPTDPKVLAAIQDVRRTTELLIELAKKDNEKDDDGK